MPRRVVFALLAVVALSVAITTWWNASRSENDVLSAESDEAIEREVTTLAPPSDAPTGTDREALGASPTTSSTDASTNTAEPTPPPPPMIVTARLAHPVPNLADTEFMLFTIDPASPLAPYSGTPVRLGRPTEVPIPAGLELVQLQITDERLILDPQPHVRSPAGAEIELVLDASGSIVVRVDEPWLSAPDLKVYTAESDRRDIWTEVMEGRGQEPDVRGECRFDGLPPGSYLVQLENSVTKEKGALRRIARVQAGRTTTIDVGGPEPAPLVLEGTVFCGTEPLVGAEVMVGSFELSSGDKTRTDADGRFEVSLQGPGRYVFQFDRFPVVREVNVLGTAQRFEVPCESLCVLVRDVDGSPRSGARVQLDPLPAPGVDPHLNQLLVATTQSDGSVCFVGLAPGRYVATLGASRWIFDDDERLAPVQEVVRLPADGPLVMHAALPNTLSGVAAFPPGAEDTTVAVYLRPAAVANAEWHWHAGTGRGGSFEAELLAGGDYELLLIGESGSLHCVSQIQRVQVPRAASDPLRIEVTRGTRLCVEARERDGAPLRLRLDIWTADGQRWPHDGMHTQYANRQTSKPLPPGTYDVYGYTLEGAALHQRIEVDSSLDTQRVVLTR